jgi:hypothetical protein
MVLVKAKFDGRVFVPEEPVDLPVGFELQIPIALPPDSNGEIKEPSTTAGPGKKTALQELVEIARTFPPNPDLPTDLAAQHDHYLYGLPKRP